MLSFSMLFLLKNNRVCLHVLMYGFIIGWILESASGQNVNKKREIQDFQKTRCYICHDKESCHEGNLRIGFGTETHFRQVCGTGIGHEYTNRWALDISQGHHGCWIKYFSKDDRCFTPKDHDKRLEFYNKDESCVESGHGRQGTEQKYDTPKYYCYCYTDLCNTYTYKNAESHVGKDYDGPIPVIANNRAYNLNNVVALLMTITGMAIVRNIACL